MPASPQISPFEERAAHETGFAAIFAAEIVPWVEAQRETLLANRRTARRRAQLIAAGALLVAIGLLFLPIPIGARLTMAGLVLFVAMGGALAVATARHGEDRAGREALGPIFARFVGADRYAVEPSADFLDLAAAGAALQLGRWNRTRLEDGLTGRWRGIGYRLVEAYLGYRRPGEKRNETAFNGLLIEIETPVAMPWTVIRPTLGPTLSALRRGIDDDRLLPLRLPGGAGDEAFEIVTEDPEAARAQIGPSFVDALERIAARQEEGCRLHAAFRGRTFTLALSRRTPFLRGVGAVDGPDAPAALCRAALADVVLPRQLIDILTGAADPPAAGAGAVNAPSPSAGR